jgi:hypothetical protein
MSKKKKAAKRAAQQSRKELLARRTGDAVAAFRGAFPTPYADEKEERADRQLCLDLREKATADVADDESAGELFQQLPDDTVAFRPWAVAFRDELAKRHGSQEEGEERARFHLAHVWIEERREELDPELARVARILISGLELGAPDSETSPPASEAETEESP